MKKDKSGIINLDIREPIQRTIDKCNKCGNPFIIEQRKGKNKFYHICPKCLNKEAKVNELKHLELELKKPNSKYKESIPNIPPSLLVEAVSDLDKNKVNWDEIFK